MPQCVVYKRIVLHRTIGKRVLLDVCTVYIIAAAVHHAFAGHYDQPAGQHIAIQVLRSELEWRKDPRKGILHTAGQVVIAHITGNPINVKFHRAAGLAGYRDIISTARIDHRGMVAAHYRVAHLPVAYIPLQRYGAAIGILIATGAATGPCAADTPVLA